MKPEDLKSPFKWADRRIIIHDRVWYLPEYYECYEEFSFPGWDDPLLFGNNHPVHVEYCSGNGAWIAQKAKEHPDLNWVAIEKQFARARKIWAKLKNESLGNLIVICAEALKVTRHYFPSRSISGVYLNFPDPWPKNRHAKHRLIQQAFVEEVWRVLKSQGRWTFVTDDADYSDRAIAELIRFPGLLSLYSDPYYITSLEGYGTSYFEELWRGKGKTIRYHQFTKEA